ncbi:VOC family protein [Micromonospora sp. CPCC 206061]|uniref:VOC family protein n=1 Tax=Micromonospora sp. CPCC 206061 TaxID=3122410 RepID=UPI002FF417F6
MFYPRLVVRDAARAIEFYVAVFDAKETARHTDANGKIVHAEVVIAGATVAVKDEDDADRSPVTLGGTPVIMALYVDDVDALGNRLEAHGATVIYPIADQPYGERGGRFEDPFGHQWMVARPL